MDVTLTLKCNNKCNFCPRKKYLKIIAAHSKKEIFSDIKKTRKESNVIVLSGGEVTLLKDLKEIVLFCRKNKFLRVGIITNGRTLSDINFAKKLVFWGINDFGVSIYSHDKKIHDRITKSNGSLNQTKRGIANMITLSKLFPIDVRINLVLNYWNYKSISKTLKVLYSWGARSFTIAEQIIISKKTKHLSIQKIKACLDKVKKIRLPGASLHFRGFAPCFLHNKVILRRMDPFIKLETYEIDTTIKKRNQKHKYINKFKDLFQRLPRCKDCRYLNQCIGIQKAYLNYED
ncbi:radical SAM protein [Thermoproteota archaeon]